MALAPPFLDLPVELRQRLAVHGEEALAAVEEFVRTAARPCIRLESVRARPAPLRRTLAGRLLGLPVAQPTLGRLATKFGGTPCSEEGKVDWEGFSFLGQINFGEVASPPPQMPSSGVFAIDMANNRRSSPFRIRWYPSPVERLGHSDPKPASVGKWETRLTFIDGWSLPEGRAWAAPLPAGDDELRRLWNAWSPLQSGDEDRHQLFGHRNGALDEHYGFEPAPGGSHNIDDYEQIWRITYDNAAGFAWGSNWVYVIIQRDDLAAGRLERAVVTGANA